MKKLYKYALWLAAAVAIAPMTACSDNDEVDPYELNLCYMYQPSSTFAQLEYKANGEFLIDIEDPLKLMPVRLTKPAPTDLDIKVEIDPSLVAEYNAANNGNYEFLTGCQVLTPVMHIKKGEYISADSVVVSFGVDHKNFQTGHPNLILPVAITQVNGGVTISKSSRIFLTFSSDYKANMIVSNYETHVNVDDALDNWQSAYTNVTFDNFFRCQWNADDAITIKATIDNSKIDAFNNVNDMNYQPLPGTTVTSPINIAVGADSAPLSLKLGNYAGVANEEMYLIPLNLEITSGEGAQLQSETVYIAVNIMPVSLEAEWVNSAPAGYTMITNQSNWTISYVSPAGVEDDYSVCLNPSSFSNKLVAEGGVVTVDLGSPITANNMLMRYNSWYYASASIENVETSVDGVKWVNWGSVALGDEQVWWITFSKPATFRYLRYVGGAPAYSSYYQPRLRHLQFYTQN